MIDQPVARVVVASSMSVYGEGRYKTPDGRVVDDARRRPDQIETGRWDRSEAGETLEPVADRREQAGGSRFGLRAEEIRAGTGGPDLRQGLRHRGGRAAPVQRFWPRPGALQSLYRRARELFLAYRGRRGADDLRGRAPAPRLRACERRRPRLPPGARAAERLGRSDEHRQRPLLSSPRWPKRSPRRWAATSGQRSPARRAPATSATASPTSPGAAPARLRAGAPARGLARRARRMGRLAEGEDRNAEMRRQLEARGLVA